MQQTAKLEFRIIFTVQRTVNTADSAGAERAQRKPDAVYHSRHYRQYHQSVCKYVHIRHLLFGQISYLYYDFFCDFVIFT